MKQLLPLLLLCLSTNNNNKSIVGTYVTSTSYTALYIQLNHDSTFYYRSSWCLDHSESDGRWRYNNDTVYLTSNYTSDDIKMDVYEGSCPNGHTCFVFKNGLPQKGLNEICLKFSDTTIFAVDMSQADSIVKRMGALKSFDVFFNSFAHTYFVKNIHSNHFVVYADTTGRYNNYRFLINEKMLFKNGNLYPLDSLGRYQKTMNESLTAWKIYRLVKE